MRRVDDHKKIMRWVQLTYRLTQKRGNLSISAQKMRGGGETKNYHTLTNFLLGRYFFLNSQRNSRHLHKKVRGISQQFPKKLRWASQAKIQGAISQQFTTKNERN